MRKPDVNILHLLLVVLFALWSAQGRAATCADVWPAGSTPNSTVAPTLPAFTGSSALTLNATLGTGDFHYAGSTLASGTLTTAVATTRLYINGSLALSGSTVLNSGGSPENLIVIVRGSLTMANTSRINGLVYVTGSASLNDSSRVVGALSAAAGITFAGTATTSYSETGVVDASYSTLCTPPVRPTLKIAGPICGVTNKLLVTFNSNGGALPLGTSATTLSNYTVTSETGTSHTVSAARLSDDRYSVQLTVTPSLSSGVDYTVAASGVKDQDGITMTAGNDAFYFSTTSNGSVGNYWGNTAFSGSPALQRIDSNINFSWNNTTWPAGSNSTGMSVRWDGYLEVPVSGTYTLRAISQDGSRVWLDDLAGTPVINRWVSSSGTATSSSLSLVAGQRYPLRAEMYKTGANSTKSMQLQWITPSSAAYAAVPNANLYTCTTSFVSNTGLVAHYPLEGPTWNGSAGEVTDLSGNNLSGTTIRTSTAATYPTASPARVCNGAVFNGNNYVRIPDGPLMDLTDAMSITAWIRLPTTPADLKTIFSKDENYEFHIDSSRRVYWWWHNSGGTARSFTSPTNSITLNTWQHIGVVYSSTRQSIYINGVERAFTTYANEILRTNNDPMEIGADQGINARIWNGSIDEIKLYDRALSAAEVTADMNATRSCTAELDHFEITVASSASVCAAVPVTIRAVQSNGSTFTGYAGTVNITTSSGHGNWSKSTANGTLNPATDTDDNGAVQYSFVAADNGQIVLNLDNSHADQLTITATENSSIKTGTSSAVQFSENAFVVTVTDVRGDDFIAGRNHELQIEAWKRDPATGECGLFTEYSGNLPLKAWLDVSDAHPSSAALPSITTTSAPVQLPSLSSAPAASNVTLAFSAGVASLQWISTDVGQYDFNVRDDSSGMVVNSSGQPLPITGSSSTFTVRPFGIYLTAPGNPAATSASGDAFVKAGANFSVQATAVQYEGADDANGDGQPDAGANLGNNTATPAFGMETPAESIVLTNDLVAPAVAAGGINPGLASGTASIAPFTGGIGSTTTSFDEVGIIAINAALTDANYLASGRNIAGVINHVGRFYPHHFQLTDNAPALRDGSASWSCDFTYQGQPFGFSTEPQLTLTALNASGNPTQNYTGDFWKLAVPQHSIELDVTSSPAGSSCVSVGAIVPGCFSENSASVSRVWSGTTTYDGEGTFITGVHTLQVNKLNVIPNSGDIPWSPLLDLVLPQAQLTDSDGACYESSGACSEYRINNISGTELRYGRGWIDNTNGPVMTPLIMTLRLQYWDAAGNFVANSADNNGCSGTTILPADIGLSDFSGNLDASKTGVAALTAQPGYYLLSLTAPGHDSSQQPNAGTASVTWLLDNDTSDNFPGEACTARWLCYDFNGDGLNENPAAKAIFSTLPDGRPLLFLKETYR